MQSSARALAGGFLSLCRSALQSDKAVQAIAHPLLRRRFASFIDNFRKEFSTPQDRQYMKQVTRGLVTRTNSILGSQLHARSQASCLCKAAHLACCPVSSAASVSTATVAGSALSLATPPSLQVEQLRALNRSGASEAVVAQVESGRLGMTEEVLGEYIKALVRLDRMDNSRLVSLLQVRLQGLCHGAAAQLPQAPPSSQPHLASSFLAAVPAGLAKATCPVVLTPACLPACTCTAWRPG